MGGQTLKAMISPDSPITCKKDDKLGRAAFAKALAKAVSDFSGDDSFVVGIHGKWGTGKSSVLNLFAEELAQASSEGSQPVDILRFNPWNFSDQNQLVLQKDRQSSDGTEIGGSSILDDPPGMGLRAGKKVRFAGSKTLSSCCD